MRFSAFDQSGKLVSEEEYFSIGGGFILDKQQIVNRKDNEGAGSESVSVPYPFTSAKELLEHCSAHNLTIAELVLKE